VMLSVHWAMLPVLPNIFVRFPRALNIAHILCACQLQLTCTVCTVHCSSNGCVLCSTAQLCADAEGKLHTSLCVTDARVPSEQVASRVALRVTVTGFLFSLLSWRLVERRTLCVLLGNVRQMFERRAFGIL